MATVVWTNLAARNLELIHQYIAEDSPTYASRFVKSLIDSTKKLEKYPSCGRFVPEFEAHSLREVIYRNYRIVYRISGNGEQVEILAVVHAARNLANVIKPEWEL